MNTKKLNSIKDESRAIFKFCHTVTISSIPILLEMVSFAALPTILTAYFFFFPIYLLSPIFARELIFTNFHENKMTKRDATKRSAEKCDADRHTVQVFVEEVCWNRRAQKICAEEIMGGFCTLQKISSNFLSLIFKS